VNEILPAILLALNSFILPIVISCAIYLKLIFIKWKLFLNKISIIPTIGTKTEQQNNINFQKKTQLNQVNDLQAASSLIASNIQEACIVIHADHNVLGLSMCPGQIQVQECPIQNTSGYVKSFFILFSLLFCILVQMRQIKF
jgi:hypothetical protein